jgi:hypothetical protein
LLALFERFDRKAESAMRLIFWTIGSLLASLSILAFAFSAFSFLALGQWNFMSSNQLWLRLGAQSDQAGEAMTLSQTIMALVPQSEALAMLDRFLVSPIFDMGFVFLVGVLGAFFLYLGRFREPDYF